MGLPGHSAEMGMDDVILVVVLVGVALILRFPVQYRRAMARLCSVEEERIPPYPRTAAIGMLLFFGFVLVWDLLGHLGGR